jgi:hypothetical protein
MRATSSSLFWRKTNKRGTKSDLDGSLSYFLNHFLVLIVFTLFLLPPRKRCLMKRGKVVQQNINNQVARDSCWYLVQVHWHNNTRKKSSFEILSSSRTHKRAFWICSTFKITWANLAHHFWGDSFSEQIQSLSLHTPISSPTTFMNMDQGI